MYLAALRYEQIRQGLRDLQDAKGGIHTYIVKGAKWVKPGVQRCRLPITPEILVKLRDVWDRSQNARDAKILRAASCLCFFGLLRSGKVVAPAVGQYDPSDHLCFEDIQVDSQAAPTCLHVRIKASKTHPFRRGVTLAVGRTDNLTIVLYATNEGVWSINYMEVTTQS